MDLVKSVLKLFISKIGKSITGFVAVVVFSRELGASPLGTYYPFIALLGVIAIPADLGINSATEKRISEGKNKEEYLATSLITKVVVITLVLLVILPLSEYINRYLGANVTQLLMIVLIFDQISSLSLSVLRGELRVGETATLEIIRPISWLAFGYFFFIQGFGVRGLIYGYLIGTVSMAIIGWIKIDTNIGQPSLHNLQSLMDYGKFSVITSVGGYVYSWVDILILTFFVVEIGNLTRGQVGAYENAWRLSLVSLMFSRSIGSTIFPQFSQWDSRDATERIENIIPKAALPSLLIVIPSFVGMTVLSKDLLRVLFGPEFTVAWLVLIVFSFEKILQSVSNVITRPLEAIDRPDLSAYGIVVSIIINITMNIILVWNFGIIGAAVATTVSATVQLIIHAQYLSRFLNISLPMKEILWSTISSIIMGLSVYYISSNIFISGVLNLVFTVLLGILIYSSVVIIYSPIRRAVQRQLGPIFVELLG